MNRTTRFVTFYSYKGGVGRTSALINCAVLRALEGNTVVVMDFDLEAPGTSPYLKKLRADYDDHREGLLEYFVTALESPTIPSLINRAVDFSTYLEGNNGGRLWVLNAGNTASPDYRLKLEKLKWNDIFESRSGERMLQNFKNQIIEEFDKPDYVFIDSRTGITETGGVCTRYLADIVVVLTSLNEQNINGTAMIYKEFEKDTKETILVAANVPIGMPYSQDQLYCQRIRAFQDKFGRPPNLVIYYYPVLALSEVVPALLSRGASAERQADVALSSTDPLLQSYQCLAKEIDKERELEVSYLPTLRSVVRDIPYYFLYTHGEEPLSKVKILKNYYSNRLLAKIVLEAAEFVQGLIKNRLHPEKWNEAEYRHLIQSSDNFKESPIQQVFPGLKHCVYLLLDEYLQKSGAMSERLELFLDESKLNSICLGEISRRRYEWPQKCLIRSLANVSRNDHPKRAFHSYNIGHCLLQRGNSKQAHKYWTRFLDEFEHFDFQKISPISKANYYFCAGLASKELGFKEKSIEMRQKSEEQIAMVSKDAEIFSPISYRQTSRDKFEQQLKKFLGDN